MSIDPSSLPTAQSSDIFDRRRVRIRRSNMAKRGGEAPFLNGQIVAQMCERLDDVKRTWASALIIGGHPDLAAFLDTKGIDHIVAGPEIAMGSHQLVCDMDRIIVAKGPFDLILWPGGIESTNDVPGALAQCRALLKPDGMMIGAFFGAGSLPALRAAMQGDDDPAHIAHFHPQIDVRAMGDILQRTGFALPTLDVTPLPVRYASLTNLLRDVRGSALNNMLAGPIHSLTRQQYARVHANFAAMADTNGRTTETLSIIHFIGWAPHPDQPKPAKRGSATASLAAAQTPKDAL